MVVLHSGEQTSLERWCSTAFLVAGGFFLVFVASNGLTAFTNTAPPRWVNGVVTASGLIAAHIGLLFLYPRVTDRFPRQALVSAGITIVGAVGSCGLLGAVIITTLHPSGAIPIAPFYLVTLLGTILAFFLCSVTCLHARSPSRTVGLSLSGPPIVLILMIGTASIPPGWVTVFVSAMQAGAFVTIGILLRTETVSTGRGVPVVDTIARRH